MDKMYKMDVRAFVSGSRVTQDAPRAPGLFADIGELSGHSVCHRAVTNGRVMLLPFLSAVLPAGWSLAHAVMIFAAHNALQALPDAAGKRYGMASTFTVSSITITGHTGILTVPMAVGIILFFASRSLAFRTTAWLLLVVVANARLITR
ncbi:MFS transporter [Erwinia amylovora]|uniref:MFS transporter n=1 Tax=Erwinia amylovora TaxID=552 RepID=UPI00144443FB|nr:MFS transporter [Erwinia amylovora]